MNFSNFVNFMKKLDHYNNPKLYLIQHEGECIAHNLRKFGEFKDDVSIGEYNGPRDACSEYYENLKTEYREILLDPYMKRDFTKSHVQCISRRIDDHKMVESFLNIRLLNLLHSERRLSNEQYGYHKGVFEAVEITIIRTNIFLYECFYEKSIEQIFNFYKGIDFSGQNDDWKQAAQYCLYEFSVTNRLFAIPFPRYSDHFIFKYVSPEMCLEKVIKPLADLLKVEYYKIDGSIIFNTSPNFVQCYRQKQDELMIVEKMMAIHALSKWGMTENEREFEYRNFIERNRKLIKHLYENCLYNKTEAAERKIEAFILDDIENMHGSVVIGMNEQKY